VLPLAVPLAGACLVVLPELLAPPVDVEAGEPVALRGAATAPASWPLAAALEPDL
jgi:hypothetical protein